jgi:hypothetical protein
MHGTFRVHARISRASEARLTWASADARGTTWARTAFLLSGWTLLGTAWHAPTGTPALPPPVVAREAPTPGQLAGREPEANRSLPAKTAKPAFSVDRFVPVVRINLPAPPPAVTEAEAPPPSFASAAAPIASPEPLPRPSPEASAAAALRPVDIEQIAEVAEPDIASDDATFAEKAQIAQLSLPRAVEQELALLQDDAPAEIAVRLGDRTLGKVAVRVSQINTVDVQLSGLLDLVADRFAPEEFARLRGSAAANGYVSLDQLRAVGLGLRYDPAYDELVVST